ncbi:MAG: hypothetical protein K8R35_01270 [Bacteroidales bacterium]|nr:hypothetical protein [Bacteroidales bacterium]
MKTVIVLLFLLIFCDCRAQKIEDVTATKEGNSILVSYSLVDSSVTPDFNISLYCSGDGGTSWQGPMVFVSGDVSADVLAGDNNQIIWDVLKEWDYLYGDNIKFRIDAKLSKKTEFIGDSMIIDLRDSSIYKVVTIGDNIWMAENLKIRTKTGSACYDNKPENCIKYGRLYNWYTATKVCPNGWHLPSHDEMIELTEIAGGKGLGARELKSVEGWNDIPKKMRNYSKTKVFSNNETGFNAISAGQFANGFRGEGWIASFWTITEASSLYPYSISMVHYLNSASLNSGRPKSDKYSVRCIKDKKE